MGKRILLVQGHPDSGQPHFNHALADAYARGAGGAGHDSERIEIALKPVQRALHRAEHVVIFFPLWLGGMPALLKGVFEQVARPGFALSLPDEHGRQAKLLGGRSARVVVTMGMPALVYRWYFRAHSVKALERNILGFVGFAPVRETLIGSVESMDDADRQKWLARLAALGRGAA